MAAKHKKSNGTAESIYPSGGHDVQPSRLTAFAQAFGQPLPEFRVEIPVLPPSTHRADNLIPENSKNYKQANGLFTIKIFVKLTIPIFLLNLKERIYKKFMVEKSILIQNPDSESAQN
jgi:hypothetical protein